MRDIFLRVPLAEKIIFAKHLSMMIKSGMTELEGIKILRNQVNNKGFGKILDEVIFKIENGQFLSDGLRKYKNVFGDLFINIIHIGEISGTLPNSLEFLAVELKKSQQIKSKVKSALIYPTVILIATLAIVGVLVFMIFPKIMPVFTSMRVDLPITTKILIAASTFLQQYFLFIVAGFIALLIILAALMRLPKFKYAVDRTILSLPIFGKISIDYNMSNITRTSAILLKSGVKIVESMQITSTVISNSVYKEILLQSAKEIEKGEMIYKLLEKNPKVFPPLISRMIEVGEKTGNLDGNLNYLAEFYEEEIDEITKNLSSVLEPLLLVIMGLMVGFVALAIITPIYSITQNLKIK